MESILNHCHTLECGGQRTAAKVLQSGFYWPILFKDADRFVSTCDKCQRMGSISKWDEPPLQTILEVELFDIWGWILWVHSPLHLTIYTFFWQWTMSPNGWSVTPGSRSDPIGGSEPKSGARYYLYYILYCTGTLIDLFFLRAVPVPVVYKQFL